MRAIMSNYGSSNYGSSTHPRATPIVESSSFLEARCAYETSLYTTASRHASAAAGGWSRVKTRTRQISFSADHSCQPPSVSLSALEPEAGQDRNVSAAPAARGWPGPPGPRSTTWLDMSASPTITRPHARLVRQPQGAVYKSPCIQPQIADTVSMYGSSTRLRAAPPMPMENVQPSRGTDVRAVFICIVKRSAARSAGLGGQIGFSDDHSCQPRSQSSATARPIYKASRASLVPLAAGSQKLCPFADILHYVGSSGPRHTFAETIHHNNPGTSVAPFHTRPLKLSSRTPTPLT